MDTSPGVVLGTPAYMAPEQAKGRDADHRADVWALGCIIYEMLAGRAPFEGHAPGATRGRAKKRAGLAPAATAIPGGIRRLLRRCLQKDPRQRLQHAGDARLEIDEAQQGEPADDPVRMAFSNRWGWLAWTLVPMLALLAVAATFGMRRPAATSPELRLEISTPPTTDPASFSISPDGQKVVYVGAPEGRLTLRYLSSTTPRGLPGTDGASLPFWSPEPPLDSLFC